MSIKSRLDKLERAQGVGEARTILVIRDEAGHTLYPSGAPKPGDKVVEIFEVVIGGIDLEDDI